jgi:hypothetical protein
MYAIHLVRAWNGSLETNRPERGRQSNSKRTLCVNACPGGGDEMEPEKIRKKLPSHFFPLPPLTLPLHPNGGGGKDDPIDDHESHSNFYQVRRRHSRQNHPDDGKDAHHAAQVHRNRRSGNAADDRGSGKGKGPAPRRPGAYSAGLRARGPTPANPF